MARAKSFPLLIGFACRNPNVFNPRHWFDSSRVLQEDVQIPNADRAVIEPAKLYGYLLAPSHPIRARLEGPSGASADTVSVWVVRTGEEFPRFVTAYPEGSR